MTTTLTKKIPENLAQAKLLSERAWLASQPQWEVWPRMWDLREKHETRAERVFTEVLGILQRDLDEDLVLETAARVYEQRRLFVSKAYEKGPPTTREGRQLAARLNEIFRANLSGRDEDGLAAYLSFAMELGEDAGQWSLESLGLNETFKWTHVREMARDLHEVRGSKLIQNAYGTHQRELANIIVDATDPRHPKTIGEVQKEIRGRWSSLTAKQANRIARTETAAVWEATNWHVMRNNGVERARWLVASGPSIGVGRGPCFICLSNAAVGWHKITRDFPSGDAMPPAHPNCVLPDTLVGGPPIEAGYRRKYSGTVLELRTFDGHHLTITPNHPVLTSGGWKTAGELREGDQLIRARRSKTMASGVVPDDEHRPSRIDDVLESLIRSRGFTTSSLPGTAEQFHGDGMSGEVDVVRADGLLWDEGKTTFEQPLVEDALFSGVKLQRLREGILARDGSVATLAPIILLSTNGVMCGGDLTRSLLGSHQLPLEELSFSVSSNVDTRLTQDLDDRPMIRRSVLPIDEPVLLRQSLSRFAGEIELDTLVEIERRWYDGHVYNLQTEDGWYSANSIITKNCRCTLIADLQGWLPPQTTWTGSHPRAPIIDAGLGIGADLLGVPNPLQWIAQHYRGWTFRQILAREIRGRIYYWIGSTLDEKLGLGIADRLRSYRRELRDRGINAALRAAKRLYLGPEFVQFEDDIRFLERALTSSPENFVAYALTDNPDLLGQRTNYGDLLSAAWDDLGFTQVLLDEALAVALAKAAGKALVEIRVKAGHRFAVLDEETGELALERGSRFTVLNRLRTRDVERVVVEADRPLPEVLPAALPCRVGKLKVLKDGTPVSKAIPNCPDVPFEREPRRYARFVAGDHDEMDRFLALQFGEDYHRNLEHHERNVLSDYVVSYEPLNEELRDYGEVISTTLKALDRDLGIMFETAPRLKGDVAVSRAIIMDRDTSRSFFQSGAVMKHDGYMSTSLDEDVIELYGYTPETDKVFVRLDIGLPTGTRVLWGIDGTQRELLLNKGRELMITDVRWVDNDEVVVRAELIQTPEESGVTEYRELSGDEGRQLAERMVADQGVESYQDLIANPQHRANLLAWVFESQHVSINTLLRRGVFHEWEFGDAWDAEDYADMGLQVPMVARTKAELVRLIHAWDESFAENAIELPEDVYLWRGLEDEELREDFAKGGAAALIGKPFHDRSFVSMGFDKDTANQFGRVFIKVRAPRGTRGILVNEPGSQLLAEQEFILNRNTGFRIVNAYEDDEIEDRLIVEVEIDDTAKPYGQTFFDETEAQAFLDENVPKAGEEGEAFVSRVLSEPEYDHLIQYQRNHEALNEALRKGNEDHRFTGFDERAVDVLDAIVEEKPIGLPLTVWRGMTEERLSRAYREGGVDALYDVIYADKAYVSTSASERIAQSFRISTAAEVEGTGSVVFLVEMRLPGEQKGVYFDLADFNESEILLPRNSAFRIIEARDVRGQEGDPDYVHIVVEPVDVDPSEIDEAPASPKREVAVAMDPVPKVAVPPHVRQWARSQPTPHNLLPGGKAALIQWHLDAGFNEDDVDEAMSLLDRLGSTPAVQEESMRIILEGMENGDGFSEVLLHHVGLEERLYQEWLDGSYSRMEAELKRRRAEWELGMHRAEYDDLGDLMLEVEDRYVRETFLYRSGKHGRDIESWTSNEEGVFGTPDHMKEFRELRDEGYRILGGAAKFMGAPGEAEVTLIRLTRPAEEIVNDPEPSYDELPYERLDENVEVEELDQRLKDRYGTIEDNLEGDEFEAVVAYSGGAYEEMNEILRFGPEGYADRFVRAVEDMRVAFRRSSSTLKTNTILFRGMYLNPEREWGITKPSDTVGRVFNTKGFVSTSASEEVALNFTYPKPNSPYGIPILWEIRAPGGQPVIPLLRRAYTGEFEFVLPDNQNFRVIEARVVHDPDPTRGTGKPYWHLVVEPVSTPLPEAEAEFDLSKYREIDDPMEGEVYTRNNFNEMWDEGTSTLGDATMESGRVYFHVWLYQDINAALRDGGVPTPQDFYELVDEIFPYIPQPTRESAWKTWLANFDRTFAVHPTPDAVTAWRAVGAVHVNDTTDLRHLAWADREDLINTSFEDDAYVSTSLSRSHAEGTFGGYVSTAHERKLTMKILIDEGQPVNWHWQEEELLLPRGTKFKVVDVDDTALVTNGPRVVTLRVIRDDAAEAPEAEGEALPSVEPVLPVHPSLVPLHTVSPREDRYSYPGDRTTERTLSTGAVTDIRPFHGDGVSESYLLEVDGKKAFGKPQSGSEGMVHRPGLIAGTEIDREKASYIVSRYLAAARGGEDYVRVPATIVRSQEGDNWMVQEFIDDSNPLALESPRDDDDLRRMALFDAITGQMDRHDWNAIVDGQGKLWLIDHSASFMADENSWLTTIQLPDGNYSLTERDREMLENFKAMRESVDRDLKISNLTQKEIDAMWTRVDEMLATGRVLEPGYRVDGGHVEEDWNVAPTVTGTPGFGDDVPSEIVATPRELPKQVTGVKATSLNRDHDAIEGMHNDDTMTFNGNDHYARAVAQKARQYNPDAEPVTIDFDGFENDLEAGRRMAEALNLMLARYPEVVHALRSIRVKELPRQPDGGKTLGLAYSDGRLEFQIEADVANADRMTESTVAWGFHPQGTDAYEGTIFHEFGHVLDFFYDELGVDLPESDEMRRRIANRLADTFLDPDALDSDETPETMRRYMLMWMEGKLPLYSADPAAAARYRYIEAMIEENVSRYAITNPREFFAESMSEYFTSSSPRPIALIVGQEFDRWYRVHVEGLPEPDFRAQIVVPDAAPIVIPKTPPVAAVQPLEWESMQDAHKWARSNMTTMDSELLSDAERDSLDLYKEDSSIVNDHLRNRGIFSELGGEQAVIMDEIFEVATTPLAQSIIVYRGTPMATLREVLNDLDIEEMVGAEWQDDGFVSTSFSEGTARDFASEEGDPVVMKITLPAGARTLYMEGETFFSLAEREVLLNRGHIFRVTKAWQDDDGVVRLDVEVVSRNAVPLATRDLEPLVLTPDMADDWARANLNTEDDRSFFTEAQRDSLMVYRGPGYHDINNYLRGKHDLVSNWPDTLEEVRHLRAVMQKTSRMGRPVVLWRGVPQGELFGVEGPLSLEDAKRLVGGKFTDRGLISTSLLRDKARSFGVFGGYKANILLELNVDPDVRGVYLGEDEHEVLLEPDLEFTVTEAYETEDAKVVLRVDVKKTPIIAANVTTGKPVEFGSYQAGEAHDWLRENVSNMYDDDFEDARSDLWKYKSDAEKLNELLRTGKIYGRYVEDIDQVRDLLGQANNIDVAIDRAKPLQTPLITWRGTKRKFLGISSVSTNDLVGRVFADEAFTSTTLDLDTVYRWFSTEVIIKLELMPGQKGIHMETPDTMGELEYLLPRNQQYKIVAAEEQNGILRLTVRVVDKHESVVAPVEVAPSVSPPPPPPPLTPDVPKAEPHRLPPQTTGVKADELYVDSPEGFIPPDIDFGETGEDFQFDLPYEYVNHVSTELSNRLSRYMLQAGVTGPEPDLAFYDQNLRLVQRIAHALNRIAARYPAALKVVKRISATYMSPTALGSASSDGDLSLAILHSDTAADAMHKLAVMDGYHPLGTEVYEATVYHEFAHMLDFLQREKSVPRKDDLFLRISARIARDVLDLEAVKTIPDVPPDFDERDLPELVRAYLAEDDLSGEMRMFMEELVKRELSEYALKNQAEFFAEAMEEFMTSSSPRLIALIVGEEYDRWYAKIIEEKDIPDDDLVKPKRRNLEAHEPISFHTFAAAHEWAVENLLHVQRLSAEARDAVYLFKEDLRLLVNDVLRKIEPGDEETDHVIGLLDEAMEEADPLTDRLVVYTTVDGRLGDRSHALRPEDLQAGMTWTDDGFVSTSLNRGTALSETDDLEEPTLVRLTLDRDVRALYLEDEEFTSDNKREVLLDRGLVYRVTAVEEDTSLFGARRIVDVFVTSAPTTNLRPALPSIEERVTPPFRANDVKEARTWADKNLSMAYLNRLSEKQRAAIDYYLEDGSQLNRWLQGRKSKLTAKQATEFQLGLNQAFHNAPPLGERMVVFRGTNTLMFQGEWDYESDPLEDLIGGVFTYKGNFSSTLVNSIARKHSGKHKPKKENRVIIELELTPEQKGLWLSDEHVEVLLPPNTNVKIGNAILDPDGTIRVYATVDTPEVNASEIDPAAHVYNSEPPTDDNFRYFGESIDGEEFDDPLEWLEENVHSPYVLNREGIYSDEDYDTIANYVNYAFETMNRKLRLGEVIEKSLVFDDIFENKAPTTSEDIVVWRGAHIQSFDEYSDEELIGRVFQDDAFISTSLDRDVAETFAARGSIYGTTVFEIRLPAGEPVIYTGTNEHELILDRGQAFKIISVGHIEVKPGKVARHIVLEPMGKGKFANTIKSRRLIRMRIGGAYRSVVGSKWKGVMNGQGTKVHGR